MIPIILQVIPEIPKDELPTSWAVWIILGLLGIGGIILKIFCNMHKEAVGVLKEIAEGLNKNSTATKDIGKDIFEVKAIQNNIKTEISTVRENLIVQSQQLLETKTDIKEIKYAIQNIDCANDKTIQMKKRA